MDNNFKFPHAPAASPATPSDIPQAGLSYQLALEHVFTYPGTFQQIPLRAMYSLNTGTRTPAFASRPGSPLFDRTHEAAAQFTTALISQISSQALRPCSLPPAFITTFLRRCFATELELVDFPQAITGLDYLYDLETRRRRDLESALGRVGLNRENIASEADAVCAEYPEVREWLQGLERREGHIEALYTQLFVALRRWILINELSLQPFDKQSCTAMLNTLYPPMLVSTTQRTLASIPAKITSGVLKEHRDGFSTYVAAVEKRGPSVLTPLMQQGKGPDHKNGWDAVRETLDAYLVLANSMIGDAAAIRPPVRESFKKRKEEKADSGVSFSGRPSHDSAEGPAKHFSKRSRTSIRRLSPFPEGEMDTSTSSKAVPPAPAIEQTQRRPDKSLSTLEKIARELRKIRNRRRRHPNADKENVPLGKGSFLDDPPDDRPAARPPMKETVTNKSLRTLRSMGDLRSAIRPKARPGPSIARASLEVSHMQRDKLMRDVQPSSCPPLERKDPGLRTELYFD